MELLKELHTFLSEAWQTLHHPGTVEEAEEEIADALAATEKFAKKFKTDSTSVPSAPDSSKFRAMKSGEVGLEKNVTVHGSYGSSRRFPLFLKIGGAVSYENVKKIQHEFIGELAEQDYEINREKLANDGVRIECTDGVVWLQCTHGTNWGGIGYWLDHK